MAEARMTDEFELAKAVHGGELDLICTEMQLLRCPGYHDSLLDGTGVIRSDKQGRLSFEMVAPMRGFPDIVKREQRPHGQLHDPTDHAMLRAVDLRGREWRSNWFIPRLGYRASESPNWI